MSKPKKLERAVIEAMVKATAGDLATVEANAAEIARNACDWVDDGRKGVSYDAVKRGGHDSTGPERAALAAVEGREDEGAKIVADFVGKLTTARKAARELRRASEKLIVDRSERARAEQSSVAKASQRQPASGPCLNCGDECSGIGDDRLRGGRCDACRKYLDRHGMERPRELWAPEEPEAIAVERGYVEPALTRCTATKGRAEVEYVCTLPQGHEATDVEGGHQWEPVVRSA